MGGTITPFRATVGEHFVEQMLNALCDAMGPDAVEAGLRARGAPLGDLITIELWRREHGHSS
jgi:hypothetical protein